MLPLSSGMSRIDAALLMVEQSAELKAGAQSKAERLSNAGSTTASLPSLVFGASPETSLKAYDRSYG